MNKGFFYEDKAEQFLRLKKYRILERNFRTLLGEVDIIARDREATVFIEVKARHCRSRSQPQETVTKPKRDRLRGAALSYVSDRPDQAFRYDVVSIVQGSHWRIYRLFKNAFLQDEGI